MTRHRHVRWGVAALALALALVAGACGREDQPAIGPGTGTGTGEARKAPTFDAGTTMAAIQSRGRLVVGTKFDQPLFGLKNPVTGAVDGFDAEIGRLMAKGIFGDDINGKVEFVETVSAVREDFIEAGRVDIVVATYTINDERKKRVDFAGPYYVADQDVMVRADDNSIKGVGDLAGKKVCSATGSTSLRNVRAQAPRADTSIVFDRYSLCAVALADRRVDAVSTDDAILAGLVETGGGRFKLVGADLSDEPYGIGLKRGDDRFRAFLNDRLEATFTSGEWERAFQATVGKVITPTPAPPRVDRYGTTGGATATTTSSTSTTSSTTSTTTP